MPTFKSGNTSLSISGMFSSIERSPLVRISGTLDQFKYIQILKKHVIPFKDRHSNADIGFMYQHGGCRPHRAKRVAEFLHQNSINVLSWPGQSPDLNPIENVWPIMKRRLRMQPKYPSTSDELYEQLSQIWNELPNNYFIKLSHYMVQRCRMVKNVNGCSCIY